MHLRLLISILVSATTSLAAEPPSAAQVQRAQKITADLELADAAQATRVRDIIARHYQDLAVVHSARDTAVQAAKDSPETVTVARDAATARQNGLHYAYLAALSVEMPPEKIEKVKDAMTYGVVPLTFRTYQEMLPDLPAEQKRRLLAWLVEAREHAMDAGSSEEKHAWFGKYKGRINNYLSAAGIDMKQAERAMMERRKQAKPGH